MSEPVSGNHNDLYEIEVQFELVTGILKDAEINIEGLFMNADAGFDSQELRKCCESKEIMQIFVLIKEMVIMIGMNILIQNCTIRDML